MAQTQTEPKKNKTKGRINSIYGFHVDNLNREVMLKYIADNAKDIEIDESEMGNEQIAVALSAHFREKVNDDEDKLVKCDECSGVATDDTAFCPFCGDGSDAKASTAEETEEEDEEEESKPAKKSAAKGKEENEEEEDEGDDEGDEDEEEKPTKKKAAATEKTEKTMTTAAETNGVSKKMTKAGSTALSTADLDTAVKEFTQLRNRGAEVFWEMGKKLLEINIKQLWKLRVDEKGKAVYKGFDQFVEKELGITSQSAYNSIDVAKHYETAKEVRELGQTKALLLLKAHPKDRPALKAKAKAGASKREIEKDVKESRKRHGSPKKGKKAEAGAKGAAKRAEKTSAEKITVAAIEGSKTLKLFKRPDDLRNVDWKEQPRAKRIADHPFAKHTLANGVVQYFTVIEKEGVLALKVETKRAPTSVDE